MRLANLKSDRTTLSSFLDTWDSAGNRTSRAEASGDRVTWTYDNAYQLTRERRSGAAAYDVTYTFDNGGNRRTKLESAIRTTYVYDAANQLKTLKDNTGTTTYTFDNCGNQRSELTPAGSRTTNTWDFENRLTKVQLPGGTVNTFLYNGDNQRVQSQDASTTLKQVCDGSRVLLETNASNATQAIYTLTGGDYGDLISQRRGTRTNYFLFDPLGSADRLVNSSQAVTDSYIYKAFGEIAASTGSTTNPFRFVGRMGYYFAQGPSLYYVRARWLRSSLARWLSADPLGLADGLNRFVYVANGPTAAIDPSGYIICACGGGILNVECPTDIDHQVCCEEACWDAFGEREYEQVNPDYEPDPTRIPPKYVCLAIALAYNWGASTAGKISAKACREACNQLAKSTEALCRELCKMLKNATCTGVWSSCEHLLRHRQKRLSELCIGTYDVLCVPKQK